MGEQKKKKHEETSYPLPQAQALHMTQLWPVPFSIAAAMTHNITARVRVLAVYAPPNLAFSFRLFRFLPREFWQSPLPRQYSHRVFTPLIIATPLVGSYTRLPVEICVGLQYRTTPHRRIHPRLTASNVGVVPRPAGAHSQRHSPTD